MDFDESGQDMPKYAPRVPLPPFLWGRGSLGLLPQSTPITEQSLALLTRQRRREVLVCSRRQQIVDIRLRPRSSAAPGGSVYSAVLNYASLSCWVCDASSPCLHRADRQQSNRRHQTPPPAQCCPLVGPRLLLESEDRLTRLPSQTGPRGQAV